MANKMIVYLTLSLFGYTKLHCYRFHSNTGTCMLGARHVQTKCVPLLMCFSHFVFFKEKCIAHFWKGSAVFALNSRRQS